MSSTYRITAVRVETTADDPHEHITRVRIGLDSRAGLSRSTVVSNLRDAKGDRYDTFADGVLADVVVRACPTCPFSDYVTTTPDSTTANNLLALPRY